MGARVLSFSFPPLLLLLLLTRCGSAVLNSLYLDMVALAGAGSAAAACVWGCCWRRRRPPGRPSRSRLTAPTAGPASSSTSFGGRPLTASAPAWTAASTGSAGMSSRTTVLAVGLGDPVWACAVAATRGLPAAAEGGRATGAVGPLFLVVASAHCWAAAALRADAYASARRAGSWMAAAREVMASGADGRGRRAGRA